MNAIAIALHVVAAAFWIGGMFFALIILRPAGSILEPPQRLTLWAGVFKRFFPWVWMAVVVLIISGYWLVFNWFNGFANTPDYVHLMHLLGWVMTLIFAYLYYRPYPQFKQSVASQDWPKAAAAMERIRLLVSINLILGIFMLVSVTGLQRLV